MREIKFRAWDKETKEMSYDFLSKNWLKVCIESPYVELMQYTGLKDKNGKEIYEGDLITITNPFINQEAIGVAEIVFSYEYVGGWIAESENGHLNIGTRTHMINVIGNIYSNPELVKS